MKAENLSFSDKLRRAVAPDTELDKVGFSRLLLTHFFFRTSFSRTCFGSGSCSGFSTAQQWACYKSKAFSSLSCKHSSWNMTHAILSFLQLPCVHVPFQLSVLLEGSGRERRGLRLIGGDDRRFCELFCALHGTRDSPIRALMLCS